MSNSYSTQKAQVLDKKTKLKKIQNNKNKTNLMVMTTLKSESTSTKLELLNGWLLTFSSLSKVHKSLQLDSFKATKNKSTTDSEKEIQQVNIWVHKYPP